MTDTEGTAPRGTGLVNTERLRFLLAAILAGVYFSLVLVMAMVPAPLATVLRDGGIISFGMLASAIMIMLVFGIMGAFVWWLDRRTAQRA